MAKICLLAKLAFGTSVPVEKVPCKGISSIDAIDFKNSASINSTIKLTGNASISPDGKKVSVYVTPVVVDTAHVLASARGPGNAVLVNSKNMGICSYLGPGAGRYPTANSVVADIVRLASCSSGTTSPPPPFPVQTSHELDMDYSGSFYIRTEDAAAAEAAASKHNIAISEKKDGFIITGDGYKLSQIQALSDEIKAPIFMPIFK